MLFIRTLYEQGNNLYKTRFYITIIVYPYDKWLLTHHQRGNYKRLPYIKHITYHVVLLLVEKSITWFVLFWVFFGVEDIGTNQLAFKPLTKTTTYKLNTLVWMLWVFWHTGIAKIKFINAYSLLIMLNE